MHAPKVAGCQLRPCRDLESRCRRWRTCERRRPYMSNYRRYMSSWCGDDRWSIDDLWSTSHVYVYEETEKGEESSHALSTGPTVDRLYRIPFGIQRGHRGQFFVPHFCRSIFLFSHPQKLPTPSPLSLALPDPRLVATIKRQYYNHILDHAGGMTSPVRN